MALRLTLTTDDPTALLGQRGAVPVPDRVIDLAGPGAIGCLQGIFTNEVEKVATPSLLWGAVLTPKGMIISDLWVVRRDDSARLIVPAEGYDAVRALLARSFPPRLAKSTPRDDLAVAWLTGAPPVELEAIDIIPPPTTAPFTALAIGPANALMSALATAGFPAHPAEYADAQKLLAGWPTLGREIDDRTLVQEVRFDELDGVRYDKGCYVGQETVARLHFRGHPNRTLRGLRGDGAAPSELTVVAGADQREVGVITTIGTLPDGWLGLAKIRREVETGSEVEVGGQRAKVVEAGASRQS